MAVPQKRTNVSIMKDGVIITTTTTTIQHLQPQPQWLLQQPPPHNTVDVTTNHHHHHHHHSAATTITSTTTSKDDDGYVANGTNGHRIVVGMNEHSEDGWMSSPSKHRILLQQPIIHCSKNGHSSIHFCGGNNNNNKKKRIWVSRSNTFSFLFMLLLLLISFIYGYRNSSYTYLLYQQPQQQVLLSSQSSSFNNHHVSTPLLHEQQQQQQRLLPLKETEPRLRKQWYKNPFRISQSNHDPTNLQQPKVEETPFRFWNQLWIRHRQKDQQQMKDQQQQNHNIFQNTNHIITLQDLTDLKNQYHHHSDIITSNIHSPPPIKHMTTTTTTMGTPQQQETATTLSSTSTTTTTTTTTILDMIQQRMGIQIDDEIAALLPTWEQVTELYGRQPIIYGISNHNNQHHNHKSNNSPEEDVCQTYRNRMKLVSHNHPQQQQQQQPRRYLGVAGQMNTGTNALAKYLLQNIYIPSPPSISSNEPSERTTDDNKKRNNHGILWTVPWYKHSWSSLYQQYHYDDQRPTMPRMNPKSINKKNNINIQEELLPKDHSHVMAIILIRDPYFWMQSMCGSPYSLEWQRNTTHCPNLVNIDSLDVLSTSSTANNNNMPTQGSQVRIRWGPTGNYIRTWPSLVEMYNEWYNEYVVNTQNISRIIIRFEDLLFHTEYVVNAIRECVDAKWIHTTNVTTTIQDEHGDETVMIEERPVFQYTVSPAKTHPYFAQYKPPSSYLSALIKYGQDEIDGRNRYGSMSLADIEYAQTHLNPELLKLFHYQINPSRRNQFVT